MTSSDGATARIDRLDAMTDASARGLAEVLVDCVDGGASVSFMWPLDVDRATAYWRDQADEIAAEARILLVARDANGIVGTVQVVPAQSENQPHRADLAKMLVHRRARGRGIGSDLVRAAEVAARAAGKSLLVLDTATGSDAERLYARLGWQQAGIIPDYALLPRGGRCSTTLFYRWL